MATRDEKETLETIKDDLRILSERIVNQAEAVTDRVTRIRLTRLAGETLRVAMRVSDLID